MAGEEEGLLLQAMPVDETTSPEHAETRILVYRPFDPRFLLDPQYPLKALKLLEHQQVMGSRPPPFFPQRMEAPMARFHLENAPIHLPVKPFVLLSITTVI